MHRSTVEHIRFVDSIKPEKEKKNEQKKGFFIYIYICRGFVFQFYCHYHVGACLSNECAWYKFHCHLAIVLCCCHLIFGQRKTSENFVKYVKQR